MTVALTKDGPEGWLSLSDLEQREGGMAALGSFETARAKKAARRSELAGALSASFSLPACFRILSLTYVGGTASALRKEEARVAKELKEVERKYGGGAEETEEAFLERRQQEAR